MNIISDQTLVTFQQSVELIQIFKTYKSFEMSEVCKINMEAIERFGGKSTEDIFGLISIICLCVNLIISLKEKRHGLTLR